MIGWTLSQIMPHGAIFLSLIRNYRMRKAGRASPVCGTQFTAGVAATLVTLSPPHPKLAFFIMRHACNPPRHVLFEVEGYYFHLLQVPFFYCGTFTVIEETCETRVLLLLLGLFGRGDFLQNIRGLKGENVVVLRNRRVLEVVNQFGQVSQGQIILVRRQKVAKLLLFKVHGRNGIQSNFEFVHFAPIQGKAPVPIRRNNGRHDHLYHFIFQESLDGFLQFSIFTDNIDQTIYLGARFRGHLMELCFHVLETGAR